MNDAPSVHHASGHGPDPAIAAYALGVLDVGERAALEAHLAGCVTCRAELARYENVVGDLGYLAAPVPPRPGVRDALLAEIAAAPAPVAPIRQPRLVPVQWLGVAAAVAVLAVAMLGFLLNQTLQERDEARYIQQDVAEYLANGGSLSPLRPAPGAPPDALPGNGTLAVAPDQSGAMLIVYDLPPTGDGVRYVAWAERDGERVDLGELTVNDEGVGTLHLYGPEPMSTYETIGITRFTPDAPGGEPFLLAPVA